MPVSEQENLQARVPKAGKVLGTPKSEISKDWKVTRVAAHGTNGDGQETTSSAVYDKE
jgi:hypothetical protein